MRTGTRSSSVVLQSSLIACNRIKSCSEGKFVQKEHDQLRSSNRDDRGRNRDSVNVVLPSNWLALQTFVSRWQFLNKTKRLTCSWTCRHFPDLWRLTNCRILKSYFSLKMSRFSYMQEANTNKHYRIVTVLNANISLNLLKAYEYTLHYSRTMAFTPQCSPSYKSKLR